MPTPTTPTQHRLRAAGVSLATIVLCVAVSACGSSNKAKSAAQTALSSATYATASAASATSAAPAGSHSSGATGASNNGGTSPSSHGTSPSPSPSANTTASSHTESAAAHPKSKYPPALVAALKTFATCVRTHGQPINEPNLSGHGEVFSDKGVNSNSPQFHHALESCEGDLLAILRVAAGSHAHIPGLG